MEGDARYLEQVATGKIAADEARTRDYAARKRRELRRALIAAEIKEAKADKDAARLEELLAASMDPFFEPDLRASALAAATEIRRSELRAAIEAAIKAEDLEVLEKIAGDTADPYLSGELRKKAADGLAALRVAIAKRERERLRADCEARLEAAFEAGDSGFLALAAEGRPEALGVLSEDSGLKRKAALYAGILADPDKSPRVQRVAGLDRRVRWVPPAIASNLASNPDRYIGPLVQALVKDVADPFEKVKLIHDWIADNVRYNFEGLLSGDLGANSWRGVLRSGKSVCAGYANLFDEMCRLGGIDARVVIGWAKGYSYNPFADKRGDTNHAWNTVWIGGKPYLVDVTWDSGYINAFGQNVKDYSTEYLFAEPAHFVYSHLPESEMDQLLPEPLSYDEFIGLPSLKSRFFEYGLAFVDGEPRGVQSAAGSLELRLLCPDSIQMDAALFPKDQRRSIDRSCIVLQEKGSARILVSFPENGDYRLVLFVAKDSTPASRMDDVLELAVSNTGDARERPAFPRCYSPFHAARCRVVEPLSGVLEKGKEYLFVIESPRIKSLAFKLGREMREFERVSPNTFAAAVLIPSDGKEFTLYIPDKGSSWTGLVSYEVR